MQGFQPPRQLVLRVLDVVQDRQCGDAILPQFAIDRMWQILRDRGELENTIVTTGVGQHQMWAAQYFRFNSPRNWITSGGLGRDGLQSCRAAVKRPGCPSEQACRGHRR